ncbi:DUF4178 domain-containing protein [Hymenobacter sp. B81]|uniref:DUF4178 domain-containing protein n=1 Tax=Hymenobacter sp. B81 TaxID=3344878 RepID=UPI0037DCA445
MSEPAAPSFVSAQLTCPKCHADLTYYDPEHSIFFACPKCRSLVHGRDGKNPKVLHHFSNESVPQVLPLGATGQLPDGLTYRVLGYTARHEAKSAAYRWGEYVLFSPPNHYAQLAVFEGHWTFIKPANREFRIHQPQTYDAHITEDGRRYDIYNRYSPRVPFAVGEFDWDVTTDEKLKVAEFIAPPYMLVQERGASSVDWYCAEHMEREQVAVAFGLDAAQLPPRQGVGALQPPPAEAYWRTLLGFALVVAFAAIVAQLTLLQARPFRELLHATYFTQPDTARAAPAGQLAPIITPAFEVHGPTALEVEVDVSVNNQWLELPVTLVNESSGQYFEFTKNIEYYHGYEGGENWSEGSTRGSAVLARVPAGRYHLNLYPVSETVQPLTLQLRVVENTALPSNLILLLLLVFAYPVGLYAWRRYHEQQRWANSDYGPS